MKEKELYEAPVVECYEIKLERRPLMASPTGAKNSSNDGYETNDLGEIGGTI